MIKTCLVVDDSRTVRRIVRCILEDLSFDVSEAENGLVALELCDRSMPDAILLDWNMPLTDGLSFLKALRGRPDGQSPKVIFCTSESDISNIAEAIDYGANEYIMKPFDYDIVKEKLFEVGLIDSI